MTRHVGDGGEVVTGACRPLHKPGARFDSSTAAAEHVEPLRPLGSRPRQRLLGADLTGRRVGFGPAAYLDKPDVSEAVGYELAAAFPRPARSHPAPPTTPATSFRSDA